jgi:2,4-dienoyl-CoA reductase-like NADH-dependent reductase (Old Yellow Enzyme family)/NADPH-dependent glutamate synthase beta subunit-like oxidoreductase
MADKYPVLFQPVKIGKIEIKNRLSIPPMGTNFGTGDGIVTQRHLEYYEERAKGGFGLIITEMITVDRETGLRAPKLLCVHNDAMIPGISKLVDTVHKHGASIIVQIVHPGRVTKPAFIGGKAPLAPSPIPDPHEKSMPREMTATDIKDQVEKFASAALRVKQAGCDGVELHGAHAYLVSQFMSAYANKRTDEYGGGFEGFLRFPLEIVTAMRKAVGPDFPILFRISSEENAPGGRQVPESIEMMKRLVAAGVDAVDISRGVPETPQFLHASAAMPMGFNANIAAQFKKALNVPVLVTGRINKPAIASDIIKSGKADIVHIGRQSMTDPAWPTKAREGREEDIVACISCNEACIDALGLWPRPFVTCVQNLQVGREARYAQPKTNKPKKVLVAGGGPGGMEAARTAAMRGHNVTLFEKEKALGGQIKYVAIPPDKDIYQEVARSRIKALKDLNVDTRLGEELTVDKIKEMKPDVLIVATGSVPAVLPIPGIDRKNVMSARQALTSKVAGRNVLIIGGGLVGCETADYLTGKGKNVTVVEMLDHVSRDIDPAALYFLMKRLTEKKVTILTGTKVVSIGDGVIAESAGGKKDLGRFDTVVQAVGAGAVNTLEEQARGIVPEVYVLGDAAKPGKILAAVDAAAELALQI